VLRPQIDAVVGLVDPDVDLLREFLEAADLANELGDVVQAALVRTDNDHLGLAVQALERKVGCGDIGGLRSARPTEDFALDDGVLGLFVRIRGTKVLDETAGGLVNEKLVVGGNPDVDRFLSRDFFGGFDQFDALFTLSRLPALGGKIQATEF